MTDYRFDKAERKNNPTGAPDKLPELLVEAQRRPLSGDETKKLAEQRVFGGSVLSLRLFSSLGMVLGVYALWAGLRRLFSFFGQHSG